MVSCHGKLSDARRAQHFETQDPHDTMDDTPMELDPSATAMSAPKAADKSPALAQAVAAPLTRAAIFLVVTLKAGSGNRDLLRSFCGDLSGLVRGVEFRDLEAGLSCVMGFG